MSVKKFQSAWGTRSPNNMDFFLEPDEKEGAEMDIGLLFNFKLTLVKDGCKGWMDLHDGLEMTEAEFQIHKNSTGMQHIV